MHISRREWLRRSALTAALAPAARSSRVLGAGPERPAWVDMDRATLDRAYNNSAAVPDSKALFSHWIEIGQEVRKRHPAHLDLAYGPRARNRLDYFDAGPGSPVLAFFHGGFWQMRSKDDFAFVVEPFLAAGASVAMIGYPLGPDATIDEIVADARLAVRWLSDRLEELGGRRDRLLVSGWSSGGHLAAMASDVVPTVGVLAISGLYELEPLVGSYVNDKLHMDVAAARRNSPALTLPGGQVRAVLFAGADELPEMRRQTADYARARHAAGQPTRYAEIEGVNHYTILDRFTSPTGLVHRAALTLLGL
jgi:arylformamidase